MKRIYYGAIGNSTPNGKCTACNGKKGYHYQGCREFTKADIKPVLQVIGNIMTVRLNTKDVRNLRFYFHSATRLCVVLADTLLPEVWFKNDGPNLTAVGFNTVQELSAWLAAKGARQVKKPRPLRKVYPVYD